MTITLPWWGWVLLGIPGLIILYLAGMMAVLMYEWFKHPPFG